jgi:hypothetical protein
MVASEYTTHDIVDTIRSAYVIIYEENKSPIWTHVTFVCQLWF